MLATHEFILAYYIFTHTHIYIALLNKFLDYDEVSVSWNMYTETGEVYTWGWKECVPSGKVIDDPSMGLLLDKDVVDQQGSLLTEQGN